MTGVQLAVSAIAILLGAVACSRGRMPLFYKLLLYGQVSYFFGALFTGCYALVYGQVPAGFHVGYFGHIGAYFFLLSSYCGAINRLADGGERQNRTYRCLALIPPILLAVFVVGTSVSSGLGESLPLLLLSIPMVLPLTFAAKHLLLPNAAMGGIQGMRPYHLCVILFCALELLSQSPTLPQGVRLGTSILSCLVLLALLPLAERGVRRWSI